MGGDCSAGWIETIDEGHADARNMKGREINKYINQNCAPSRTYLRDYTGMNGQQNIKFHIRL